MARGVTRAWKVDDIACALLHGEDGCYRLIKVLENEGEDGKFLCLSLLNNATFMNYRTDQMKRVVVSFVGPVVLGHEGWEQARFAWLKR